MTYGEIRPGGVATPTAGQMPPAANALAFRKRRAEGLAPSAVTTVVSKAQMAAKNRAGGAPTRHAARVVPGPGLSVAEARARLDELNGKAERQELLAEADAVLAAGRVR